MVAVELGGDFNGGGCSGGGGGGRGAIFFHLLPGFFYPNVLLPCAGTFLKDAGATSAWKKVNRGHVHLPYG